ncbi:hypothetical protein ACIQWL_36865 [Streptomyces mirabilis]|uniref:hypothetical protein n=1 Tax=Streptomyces mirabilis TaxID=68239 RepID=UPI00340B9863
MAGIASASADERATFFVKLNSLEQHGTETRRFAASLLSGWHSSTAQKKEFAGLRA